MPATCPTCGTDNRDSAMFCRGCLAKLPAFAPTAPSLLESMRAESMGAASAGRRGGASLRLTGAQAMTVWLCFGVLLLVGVLALVVWASTSARVPHMRAPAGVPVAQAAVPPPRLHAEEREVLTAAHLPVPKPESTWEEKATAQPIIEEAATPAPGMKARPARAVPVSNAKPRKDRRLTPVAMSGARAACDRYNPYGEVLCTQGGYPYRTWRNSRR
ncbi:zinc ribbon domain-containing protein [Variovorax robiniae]|uniref:Zinc ribbon domain-containing protein n=1 Tax=Variovorax robiniae TaxID=1836199 RepID=A0ABU8X6Y9_9BURK